MKRRPNSIFHKLLFSILLRGAGASIQDLTAPFFVRQHIQVCWRTEQFFSFTNASKSLFGKLVVSHYFQVIKLSKARVLNFFVNFTPWRKKIVQFTPDYKPIK